MKEIEEKDLVHQPIQGKYYKFFINLQKNQLDSLQGLLQRKAFEEAKKFLLEAFHSSFSSFQVYLGKKH